MRKMVFVPLSDEMIYDHPELITGPIGAFSPFKVDSRVSGWGGDRGTDGPKSKVRRIRTGRKMIGVSNSDRGGAGI